MAEPQPGHTHLRVFLPVDEELHLLLTHLLPEPSEEMSELHSRDQAVALLVKMLETLNRNIKSDDHPPIPSLPSSYLNKVINGVPDWFAGDVL